MNYAGTRVKQLGIFVAAFAASGLMIASANMLKNGSFETAGTAGDETAQNWKMNDTDEHGDVWGSAARVNWRAHEGQWVAAVRGTWAAGGEFGGWWQEAAGKPGTTYRVSAQFWADTTWKANAQELKIEFWNTDRSKLLGAATNTLAGIAEQWTEQTIDGTAPEGTAWVRAVVNVSGAGDAGALQIDEMNLDEAL